MDTSYEKCIIETLAGKVIEQDGEIRRLRHQITLLENLLEEEKAKNGQLEKFFTLKETDD